MTHALTMVWAAAAVLVLMWFGFSTWMRSKAQSITAILLAIVLQASLAFYALGDEGLGALLSLFGRA